MGDRGSVCTEYTLVVRQSRPDTPSSMTALNTHCLLSDFWRSPNISPNKTVSQNKTISQGWSHSTRQAYRVRQSHRARQTHRVRQSHSTRQAHREGRLTRLGGVDAKGSSVIKHITHSAFL